MIIINGNRFSFLLLKYFSKFNEIYISLQVTEDRQLKIISQKII